jgi:hypothetical protein
MIHSSLDTIRALLVGEPVEPSEEWLQILHQLKWSAVGIVAVFETKDGQQVEQAGSGTLVAIDDARYVLTAAHVWDGVLKDASAMGFTMRLGRDLPSKFLIDIKAISRFALRRKRPWDQWGPDMILLRIPPQLCGTVEAFKVFYNLSAPKPTIETPDFIETWALLGAPQILGDFAQAHAHLHGRAFQVSLAQSHHHDGFDYVDVVAHWPSKETPPNFGGVSGGGLWRVRIFATPTTGTIDCTITLEGMAFYHLGNEGEQDTIRCHGPASLQYLVSERLRKKDRD